MFVVGSAESSIHCLHVEDARGLGIVIRSTKHLIGECTNVVVTPRGCRA
jgi:hypothetical protein